MNIRTLGLDLGTNSLGWALIETKGEPGETSEGRVVDIGTRIFSAADMAGRDAKSKESLAVARRQARTMRRQRDRRLKRKKRLLKQLSDFDLMPKSKAERDKLIRDTDDGKGGDLSESVLALRAKALDEPLTPYQLGRVLFQMNQRRGFKSNRKTDGRDNEAGKIASGVSRLQHAMAAEGARTYGEFLYKRRQAGKSVRTRLRPVSEFSSDPELKGDGYEFYPDRSELETEFKAIMEVQAGHHSELLAPNKVDALRETILYQRDLVQPKVGKCSYNPDEQRLPKAHPLFQAFRLYKEVNELAVIGEDQNPVKLTPEQRDILILKLKSAKTAGFPALRKLLKLGPEYRFNKETDNRTKLEGDVIAAALSRKDCFGPAWSEKSIDEQWSIIERLREESDPQTLHAWLRNDYGLDDGRADAVMKVQLPEGYGRLGPSALANLLDALKHDTDEDGKVITEAAAAIKVYGRTNAEDDPDREARRTLPKYQEILTRHIPPGEGSVSAPPDDKDPAYDRHMGRITNPTVHIALNQLRRVVNAIIRKHGRPDRIAIELGRELKLTDKQREEVNRAIGKNTRDAEERSKKLEELGQPDTGYNRLRLKLWEELNPDQPLNRVCIYSGEPITIGDVFTAEVDVDHILPYSRTLDDSQANRLLCKARANRVKRNRAPSEVTEWDGVYDDILARAGNLPRNKQWRFARNAMDRFADEEGFAARQLTDMQYLSRIALSYLAALYPAGQADIDGVLRRHNRVRALPGRMTEMLRRKWGLNEILPDHNYTEAVKPKNRKDHRHHSIDAFVIACTSRSMIQKIASASEEIEAQGTEKVLSKIPDPWPGFRDELRERVQASVVSHKPDHGTVSRKGYAEGKGQTAGQLHNDTAYGFTGEKDDKGNDLVVRRVPITEIKKAADIFRIRCNSHGHSELHDRLWQATRDLEGKAFEKAILDFAGTDAKFRGIRHVRIVEPLKTIPIRDKAGRAYKGYKGDSNFRYDVWRLPNGKWVAEVVSTFDAHQPGWASSVRAEHPTAKKLISLHQNDMVAVERDGRRVICRVVKFGANGQITLAEHSEAGALKSRDANGADPFKYISPTAGGLKKLKARQVRIDEIGQVQDPGPRE
ncbi:type II CRISPR RNA-guided endonuclease Cas9 [Hoeflea poritis]|uniref:CRISPR-associated endonuclease Cas9 n=1 Tax=Hoeflea poritis TaxID=2993659 RepID=A0ABT4VS66_9HYPH|nr:type II CRISPR RNA-guided endonuclease Cas9 [Hoeflea poritis]MDA4847543.1 type II CRISPR RNA-guided endonuclease Cas9 [Hoeflea poritis]